MAASIVVITIGRRYQRRCGKTQGIVCTWNHKNNISSSGCCKILFVRLFCDRQTDPAANKWCNAQLSLPIHKQDSKLWFVEVPLTFLPENPTSVSVSAHAVSRELPSYNGTHHYSYLYGLRTFNWIISWSLYLFCEAPLLRPPCFFLRELNWLSNFGLLHRRLICYWGLSRFKRAPCCEQFTQLHLSYYIYVWLGKKSARVNQCCCWCLFWKDAAALKPQFFSVLDNKCSFQALKISTGLMAGKGCPNSKPQQKIWLLQCHHVFFF